MTHPSTHNYFHINIYIYNIIYNIIYIYIYVNEMLHWASEYQRAKEFNFVRLRHQTKRVVFASMLHAQTEK